MPTSGIDWVHAIFSAAVHALVGLAHLLGISYEEINVWLFSIVTLSALTSIVSSVTYLP